MIDGRTGEVSVGVRTLTPRDVRAPGSGRSVGRSPGARDRSRSPAAPRARDTHPHPGWGTIVRRDRRGSQGGAMTDETHDHGASRAEPPSRRERCRGPRARCPGAGRVGTRTHGRESESASATGHGDAHGGHDAHAGHSPEAFRSKFWLSLLLTIPVVVWSPHVEMLLDYRAPVFPGSNWIPAVLGTIVFFYGGLVFLRGAAAELRRRLPGMMTLISLAISVAFVFSWVVEAGLARQRRAVVGTGHAGDHHAARPLDRDAIHRPGERRPARTGQAAARHRHPHRRRPRGACRVEETTRGRPGPRTARRERTRRRRGAGAAPARSTSRPSRVSQAGEARRRRNRDRRNDQRRGVASDPA